MKRTLSLIVCALSLVWLAPATASPDRAEVLDYLERLQTQSGAPGVSAAVAVDGQIVFSGGVGQADLEAGTPQNGRTVHNIGSVSKVIAVTAILQLVEQGKVDLDAELQRYLPWFPRKDKPITVRHILTHTSGIRHYKDNEFGEIVKHYAEFEPATQFWRDDPLVFEPGSHWMYSSYAVNLIQGIVESVSGRAFETYLREQVWIPAGMLSTQFDVPSRVVPRRGRGYLRSQTYPVDVNKPQLQKAPDEDVSYKYAGGGMIASDEDLCRLGIALNRAQLLKPETQTAMYKLQLPPGLPTMPSEFMKKNSPGVLPPSQDKEQALMWWMGKDAAGRPYAGHAGSVKGTQSMLMNFYKQNVVVAVHFNASGADVGEAAMSIAQLFMPQLAVPVGRSAK
ncbi:serine hydrolase domain-containing protein [Steroidobacter sp.]|uniref:serine hydrolase domain-containing protein n=1 Tax=Steroidobacter sp. TaxID=1978227 RepID=UPI0025D859EE|nr:serine hydrolase domain-containing protein [Steroidobacter sp.]